MSDLSSTQFFQVEPCIRSQKYPSQKSADPALPERTRIQSGESDRWIYHVRRSDIHYKF